MILKFGIYNLKCCDLDKTETHTSNHLIKGSTALEKSSSLFAQLGSAREKTNCRNTGQVG